MEEFVKLLEENSIEPSAQELLSYMQQAKSKSKREKNRKNQNNYSRVKGRLWPVNTAPEKVNLFFRGNANQFGCLGP